MSDVDNSDKTIDMITKLNKLNKQTKGIADTLQKTWKNLTRKMTRHKTKSKKK